MVGGQFDGVWGEHLVTEHLRRAVRRLRQDTLRLLRRGVPHGDRPPARERPRGGLLPRRVRRGRDRQPTAGADGIGGYAFHPDTPGVVWLMADAWPDDVLAALAHAAAPRAERTSAHGVLHAIGRAIRAVGNAHLPHNFSELFLAMLSPQTAYAQLNMCSLRSCLCSDPSSGQSHDRSVVAPYPLGAPVGRLAMCRVSRAPL